MSGRPLMTVADRETFLALRQVLPAATRPCLQETFGVSETTWVKLRDGRPVKTSTLERVLARYRRLAAARGGADSPLIAIAALSNEGIYSYSKIAITDGLLDTQI